MKYDKIAKSSILFMKCQILCSIQTPPVFLFPSYHPHFFSLHTDMCSLPHIPIPLSSSLCLFSPSVLYMLPLVPSPSLVCCCWPLLKCVSSLATEPHIYWVGSKKANQKNSKIYMYVCQCLQSMYGWKFERMYVCMHACIYVCMHVYMYACTCMYVSMYVHI